MTNSVGMGDARFGQDDYSLISFVVQQAMNGMATATLVKVVAVHDETVDVEPLVRQIDGRGTGIDHGTIHDLPFFAIRAGACAIRIKPRVGDMGMAAFCHSDISNAKETKDKANPGSRRKFDWADGLYFGGFLAQGEPTSLIEVDADDNISVKAPTIKLTASDMVDITGPVTTDSEYRVGGVKVVGEQQGAITGPSGGSTMDSEARTTIGSILSALRAHGLISG